MSNKKHIVISTLAIMCVLTGCGNTGTSSIPTSTDQSSNVTSVGESGDTSDGQVTKLVDDSSSQTDATTTIVPTTNVPEVTPLNSDSSNSASTGATTSVVTTSNTANETTVHTKITEAQIIDNATGFNAITFGKIEYSFPMNKFTVPDSWVDDGTDEKNPVFRSSKLDGVYMRQYVNKNITYGVYIDVFDALINDKKVPGIKIHGDIKFGSDYKAIKKEYGEASVESAKLNLNKQSYKIYEYNLVDEKNSYKVRFSVLDKKGLFAVDITYNGERPDPVTTTTTTTTVKAKDNTKKTEKDTSKDKKKATTTKK